ncbi:MAG: VIT1/CCC1 transporter family protein, partial [Nitrospinaceae bacterium]
DSVHFGVMAGTLQNPNSVKNGFLKPRKESLVAPLEESDYGKASQITPWIIAAVNGLSPFLISLFIMIPLWPEEAAIGLPLPLGPLESAIEFTFVAILFLGIFVGRVNGTFWLWSGLRAVLIGLVTAGIIFLIAFA